MDQEVLVVWQIILTAVATLLGGVFLLIITEFIKLLIVEPLKKYRDHVELIIDRLDYHANYMTNFFSENPTDEEKELMRQIIKDFRTAATQLNALYASIWGKRLFIKLKLIANKREIQTAFSNLLLLSNNPPTVSRSSRERDQIGINYEAIGNIKIALGRKPAAA